DDDQSIYAWRGADLRNILDFEAHFGSVKVVVLEENYRSTQRILDAANSVIANNSARREKTMRTGNGPGPKIDYWELDRSDGRAGNWYSAVSRAIAMERLRRALQSQLSGAADRGCAPGGEHPLPRDRRHLLLRAEGDRGRRRLHAFPDQPARRPGASSDHQLP